MLGNVRSPLSVIALALLALCATPLRSSAADESVPIDQFGTVRKVFPMPARDLVTVEAFGPGSGVASIRIVQPGGRVVRKFRFSGMVPGAYQDLSIHVLGLAPGVYFLWYSDSTERYIKAGRKLVVLR